MSEKSTLFDAILDDLKTDGRMVLESTVKTIVVNAFDDAMQAIKTAKALGVCKPGHDEAIDLIAKQFIGMIAGAATALVETDSEKEVEVEQTEKFAGTLRAKYIVMLDDLSKQYGLDTDGEIDNFFKEACPCGSCEAMRVEFEKEGFGPTAKRAVKQDDLDREPLTKSEWASAVLVQDACNLSGVVHDLNRMTQRVRADYRSRGMMASTESINRHPIVVMYVTKLAHLAGIGDFSVGNTMVEQSWKVCKDNAGGK